MSRGRRRQKTSLPGYARLHKNVTKVGSRLRSVAQKRNQGRSRLRSVTHKCNQGRFPVTLGYTKTQLGSVTGYAWLHKNVTKDGSRLRSVTQPGTQLRMVTPTPVYV